MNLTEKLHELVIALKNSVSMPYENIIISIHDTHGTIHTEYTHADPFTIAGHICVLMDRLAPALHMDRKSVAAYIMTMYLNGGDDLDKQADQGDDRRDTGTPAGDRE